MNYTTPSDVITNTTVVPESIEAEGTSKSSSAELLTTEIAYATTFVEEITDTPVHAVVLVDIKAKAASEPSLAELLAFEFAEVDVVVPNVIEDEAASEPPVVQLPAPGLAGVAVSVVAVTETHIGAAAPADLVEATSILPVAVVISKTPYIKKIVTALEAAGNISNVLITDTTADASFGIEAQTSTIDEHVTVTLVEVELSIDGPNTEVNVADISDNTTTSTEVLVEKSINTTIPIKMVDTTTVVKGAMNETPLDI